MAWRDQLHPASFRGVPFEELTTALTVGRRIASHKYPQRDLAWQEDMGREVRVYKTEAYIIGADYLDGRDKLIEAVEKPGAGQMVFRKFGTKDVVVTGCELTESTEFGGMVKLTLTSEEAGEQVTPSVGADSATQLTTSQDDAFDSVGDDFASKFSVAKLPSWGVDDIMSTINGFTAVSDFNSIASSLTSFQSDLGGLLSLPGELASRVIGMVRALVSVDSLLQLPYVSLPSSNSVATSTRAKVQQQQSLVSVLFKRAALVQQAGLLTNTELATSDEVKTTRAAVLAEFDANDYAVGIPRPSSAVAANLKTVRTAALAHLSQQSVTLPKTYSLSLIEPQPALALSYALYGDLRDADIVRRNAVRHPSFVPAGVPLQLTTE